MSPCLKFVNSISAWEQGLSGTSRTLPSCLRFTFVRMTAAALQVADIGANLPTQLCPPPPPASAVTTDEDLIRVVLSRAIRLGWGGR